MAAAHYTEITVALLLPENPPQPLLDAIDAAAKDLARPQPKAQKVSSSTAQRPPAAVTFLRIAHDAAFPPNDIITAVVWVPPCKPARLASFLDMHGEVEWVHSLSAGVDYLAPVIKSHLVGSAIALSNGRGAFSESLAEYAIAAALHFTKRFAMCDQNRRARKWDKFVRACPTEPTRCVRRSRAIRSDVVPIPSDVVPMAAPRAAGNAHDVRQDDGLRRLGPHRAFHGAQGVGAWRATRCAAAERRQAAEARRAGALGHLLDGRAERAARILRAVPCARVESALSRRRLLLHRKADETVAVALRRSDVTTSCAHCR